MCLTRQAFEQVVEQAFHIGRLQYRVRLARELREGAGRCGAHGIRGTGQCHDPNHQIFAASVRDELEFGLINIGLDEEEVSNRTNRIAEEFGLVDYLFKAVPEIEKKV